MILPRVRWPLVVVVLAVSAGVFLPASGCFFFFTSSACRLHEHCPAPEQCQSYTCIDPRQYVPSGLTKACTDGDECDTGECYEGYCVFNLNPDQECYLNHDNCPVQSEYCGFGNVCTGVEDGEVLYRGAGPSYEVNLLTAADYEDVKDASVLAGFLYIGTDETEVESESLDVAELVFPNLHTITHGIVVKHQATATSLSFPALERVGLQGIRIEGNPSLRDVDLGALTTIEGLDNVIGGVFLYANPSLESVDLNRLTTVTSFVALFDPTGAVTPPGPVSLLAGRLDSVSDSFTLNAFQGVTFGTLALGSPAVVDSFTITGVDADVTDALAELASVGYLDLEGLSGTDVIRLPELVAAETGVSITSTTATRIELGRLTESPSFTVADNAALTTLLVPSLSLADSVDISDNPLLDVCDAKDIADDSGATSTDVSGNLGDEAMCP